MGKRKIRRLSPSHVARDSMVLDWRDPNMPVLCSYKMRDGSTKTEVDPDYERRYREHMMQAAEQPKFRDDPTYDLRRKK